MFNVIYRIYNLVLFKEQVVLVEARYNIRVFRKSGDFREQGENPFRTQDFMWFLALKLLMLCTLTKSVWILDAKRCCIIDGFVENLTLKWILDVQALRVIDGAIIFINRSGHELKEWVLFILKNKRSRLKRVRIFMIKERYGSLFDEDVVANRSVETISNDDWLAESEALVSGDRVHIEVAHRRLVRICAL